MRMILLLSIASCLHVALRQDAATDDELQRRSLIKKISAGEQEEKTHGI